MGGIRRAMPFQVLQIHLTPDGVDALYAIRVQVRRPCDLRNAAHHLNPRRDKRNTVVNSMRKWLTFDMSNPPHCQKVIVMLYF